MYVNVVLHVNDEGRIDLLAVIWPDGRTFRIDEVLYRGEPGQMQKGAKTSRFRIRFGRKETNLYLERRQGSPALGTPDVDRWWSTPSTTLRLSLAVRGMGVCLRQGGRQPAAHGAGGETRCGGRSQYGLDSAECDISRENGFQSIFIGDSGILWNVLHFYSFTTALQAPR